MGNITYSTRAGQLTSAPEGKRLPLQPLGRWLPQSRSEAREIRRSWNGDRAKRRQMLIAPLYVEQGHPTRPHQIHQRHQRDLRCVAIDVKHRFAGETPVNPKAVQATDEFTP